MQPTKVTKINLISRPQQFYPEVSNFEVIKEDIPTLPEDGILTKTLFLSVDPYLGSKVSGAWGDPFPLNQTPFGGGVGQVVQTKNSKFQVGDLIHSPMYPWATMAAFSGEQLNSLRKLSAKFPPEYSLGALGMPGLTAYFGLFDVGKVKQGETVLVTGASGAVGSIVGQLAKIHGCKVIGISGSSQKCEILKKELNFDESLNYHNSDLLNSIKEAVPGGIDCFFDNVGGPTFDAVIPNMNKRGRISLCGAISQYGGKYTTGPRWNMLMVLKHLHMEGFMVNEYHDRWNEALYQLEQWVEEGKLKVKQTVEEGIEKVPEALIKMLKGEEKYGKVVVRITESPEVASK
jgi:NADPH-dependent curcumin reductase CurA